MEMKIKESKALRRIETNAVEEHNNETRSNEDGSPLAKKTNGEMELGQRGSFRKGGANKKENADGSACSG